MIVFNEMLSRTISTITATVLSALMFAGTAQGQQDRPAFEVTVVKPVLDRRNSAMECSPDGHFLARGLTLRPIILWAFDLDFFQLSAVPVPVGAALFDMEGKTTRPVSQQECKQMVQALLKDRFKMSIRSEVKEIPVYALLVAKGGVKMAAITGTTKAPGVGLTVNGRPYPISPEEGWSMDQLRQALGSAAIAPELPIVDRTGLTGRYKVTLNIIIGGTDIFSAADQLGLKVESRKESLPTIVIDRIEMPDEN